MEISSRILDVTGFFTTKNLIGEDVEWDGGTDICIWNFLTRIEVDLKLRFIVRPYK